MNDIHDELRQVARAALVKQPSWSAFADLGWLGLEVPESCGGAGATFAEVAVILHELGRAAVASPYLGSVVLAAGALNLVGADDLSRAVAEGAVVALALPTGDEPAIPFRLRDGRLYGEAPFVPDAAAAEHVLVVALEGDTPVLVHAAVDVAEQPVVDETRSLATVTASGAEPIEVWPLPAGGVDHLLDRGALAVACDSLGVAEAMLEATVAYAGVREQFGRPIGSFQAVKHACADMLVTLTVGRELVTAAVESLDRRAVAMAKARVGADAVAVAGKAMQLHGGIGYTWESGIHVYVKRAALNRSLFGSPAAHRRRLGEAYRT